MSRSGEYLRTRSECERCGAAAREVLAERSLEVAGHCFCAEIPARTCLECGHLQIPSATLERFELLAAGRLAEAGVSTGEAFAFMRRALALDTDELAVLVTAAPEQLARWERYDFVPRSAVEIVGGLIRAKLEGKTPVKPDPRTALDILLSYRSPRPLARTVRLDWTDLDLVLAS